MGGDSRMCARLSIVSEFHVFGITLLCFLNLIQWCC